MHFFSAPYCVRHTSVELLSVRTRFRVDTAEKSQAHARADVRSTRYAAEKSRPYVRVNVRSTQYVAEKRRAYLIVINFRGNYISRALIIRGN